MRLSIILSFSLATWATASATEDVGTSAAMSTPLSNHCRAIETATSGLFWWSALMTSTSQSRWDFISSTASCVAATDVGPVLSRYVPERSVSTPIVSLTRPCARGRIIGAIDNAAAPPIRVRRVEIILCSPWCLRFARGHVRSGIRAYRLIPRMLSRGDRHIQAGILRLPGLNANGAGMEPHHATAAAVPPVAKSGTAGSRCCTLARR